MLLASHHDRQIETPLPILPSSTGIGERSMLVQTQARERGLGTLDQNLADLDRVIGQFRGCAITTACARDLPPYWWCNGRELRDGCLIAEPGAEALPKSEKRTLHIAGRRLPLARDK
ncbi:hypothetical protein D9M68_968190 [compost metagenome]